MIVHGNPPRTDLTNLGGAEINSTRIVIYRAGFAAATIACEGLIKHF